MYKIKHNAVALLCKIPVLYLNVQHIEGTYVPDPGILRMVICVTIELIIHRSRDHGGRRPHRLLWATESVIRRISPVVCMVINNSVAY